MKPADERIVELGKWLMESEIKYELETKIYGDDVVKVIKIKCSDIDTDKEEDEERDLHIIVRDQLNNEFLVGKWED